MATDLDESIARAMEIDIRLLPVLRELVADLWELGTSLEQIVSALDSVGVEPESTVLDLGCGKGAVAVALAERLGLRVEGVDAFPPFLDAARTLATDRGVSSRCTFREGDIRTLLGQEGRYGVVLLLSVGPIAGDHGKTIAGLRTLVHTGGYIVIEDGFLTEGVEHLPGAAGYTGRAETLRRLTSCGDSLLREVVRPAEETRWENQRITELIRRRAQILKGSHSDLVELIDEYVAGQERETEVLGRDLICAVWALRRGEN